MSKSTAWGLVVLFWCALFLLGGCAITDPCDGRWRGFEHQKRCQSLYGEHGTPARGS